MGRNSLRTRSLTTRSSTGNKNRKGNTLYFRHRNWLINNLLKLVKLFIRPDRHDPALAAAISELLHTSNSCLL